MEKETIKKTAAKTVTKKETVKKADEKIKVPQNGDEKNAVKKIPRFIYMGPNLFKYNLMKNKVYKGEFKIDEALVKRCPLIKKLLVPVSEIDTALQKMQTKGTQEYLAVQEITKGSVD